MRGKPDQQTATCGLRRMRMFIARCGYIGWCIGMILARRGPPAAPERPNRTLLGSKTATASPPTHVGTNGIVFGLYKIFKPS